MERKPIRHRIVSDRGDIWTAEEYTRGTTAVNLVKCYRRRGHGLQETDVDLTTLDTGKEERCDGADPIRVTSKSRQRWTTTTKTLMSREPG